MTDPLPGLADFLAPFRDCFARREGADALERYCAGLLAARTGWTCEALARPDPGTTGQRLQGLLTSMAWDHDALNRRRAGIMAGLAADPDGVLVLGETAVAKKGTASVGVDRQYGRGLGR